MHGYDPNAHRRQEAGGCREALTLTRIAYAILLPPIAAILGVILLLLTAFYLLSVNPLLSPLPLLPIVLGVVWLVRRSRRAQRELEEGRGR